MKNENQIRKIAHNAVWESHGCDPFQRCKGCGCYNNGKPHWDKDCPYATLEELVEKGLEEL